MTIRVTGGRLRGRRIRVPGKAVRPTQDRVREAVFSSLAEVIPGARILDVFAGSGAMGIEAFSRGGAFVCWVESDREVFSVLRENVQKLCEPKGTDSNDNEEDSVIPMTQVVLSDAMRFLRRTPPRLRRRPACAAVAATAWRRPALRRSRLRRGESGDYGVAKAQKPFDVILADPPYDHDGAWLKKLLSVLSGGSMLRHKGLFVMESRSSGRRETSSPSIAYEGWILLQTRVYGDTQITVFQKNNK